MEAACRRLCEGDVSYLVDIVNYIESETSGGNYRLGTRTLTALVNVLIHEGVELRRTRRQGQEYGLPSPSAYFAARILAQLGMHQSEDDGEVQRMLLALGLQHCRDLCLDAYFGLGRAQRYYVIMFVKLLTMLYGCAPQDLLHNETSINMFTGSSEARSSSPTPPGAAGASEAAAPAPLSARSGSNHVPVVATTTHGGALQSATRSAPSPPPPLPVRDGAANALRPSNVQNRSALLVSVPGASFDIPLRPTRRYRDLPKKPINAPFAVNPLYEDPSAPGNDGGNGSASQSPAPPSPLPRSFTAPDTVIPAQFPTPVVLFASYHGLGCVPRLPTADDLTAVDAWRRQKQQRKCSPLPPRDVQKSTAKTSRGLAEGGNVGGEFSRVRILALRWSPSSAVPPADAQDFDVHNGHLFAPTNQTNARYQRACLDSELLQAYVQHGKLLSWGSAAKGALGPHRQRHPSGGAAAAAAAAKAVQSAPSTKAATNEAAAPLTSTLIATPGPPGSLEISTMVTTTHAKGGSHGASSGSSGQTTYVYLPTPVNTPGRVALIACGLSVTYLVTIRGILYSCGRGEYGQLGIGERGLRYGDAGTSRLQSVLVKEGEAITRVAAGSACAVALAADRALYCWGHNVYGQCLKLPDLSRVLTPVRLKTSMYKVLDICFGQFFGVLLFDDGVIGTWGIASMLGCNVGDQRLEESLAPDQCKCARQVVHLEFASASPMAAVRAGPWHALAISKQGEVYTWGVGRDGRLGHGGDGAEVKPRLVEGLRSCFVVDASCASAHSAVLTSTGSVYVFGENSEGQLGLRGRSPRRLPVAMSLPGKAIAVACAREHTCVLLEDGDVVACGTYRTCGVGLGYGTRICAPVRILTNYISVTLQCGHFHSLASVVHRRTALMMVGNSTIEEVSRILSVVVRNGVRCAASGVGFLVVLSENNSLVSIGRGERGQLGIGDCMKPTSDDDVTVTPRFTPVQLPSNVVIQHLRCGPDYVVALDQDGAVYGWGSNECRKLCQHRSVEYVYTPVRLSSYGEHRIVQVACGGTFVIALTATGAVLAHGEAIYCGLGIQSPDAEKSIVGTPTCITALHDIVAIAAGRRHAVAMTSSCNVFAWGVGVLGCGSSCATHAEDAAMPAAFSPVRVALSQNIRTIGCGIHNSFAITEDGELWVWGVNYYGECGVPPNREGGGPPPQPPPPHQTEVAAAAAAALRIDTSRVIQTPISVARQVRDAAFTSQFGLVIFEDGQVRVSGRVRHGGRKYLLPSFHSNPQPHFSIDVNEAAPRCSQEGDTSPASGLTRAETATATADTTRPPRKSEKEVFRLGEEEEEDESDNDSDSSSTHSSTESGAAPRPAPTSASAQRRRPAADTDAVAVAAALPEKRPASATFAESLEPPNRSSGGGDRVKESRFSCVSDRAARASSSTSKTSSPRLPQVRSISGQLRNDDVSAARQGSVATGSSTGSAAVVTTAAQLGSPPPPPTLDLDGSADLLESTTPRSSDVSVHPNRKFPEADDGSPQQAPLPDTTAAATQAGTPSGSGMQALSTPRPPPGSPPSSGGARPTHVGTHSTTTKKHKTKSGMTSPVTTPADSASPAPPVVAAAAAGGSSIFGIRCFCGWEQICTVMEKHRPSSTEVRMAHDGLQCLPR